MSPNKRMTMAAVMRQWFLWVPCVAALAMFSVVLMEARYAAPYITIIGVVAVSSVVSSIPEA